METAGQNNFFSDSFLSSDYLNPVYLFNQGLAFLKSLFSILTGGSAMFFWKTALSFLAIFFLTVICYSTVRLFEIRKKEREHLRREIAEYAHNKAEYEKSLREKAGGSKNEHWGEVLNYLFSQHSSDWKLAIIEADAMLEGLLDQLGFKGENLGDKLKSANQNNFPQLTAAWEVHTIRNRIAHEGLSFELSQHEAKRTVALYEQIFRAYGYI